MLTVSPKFCLLALAVAFAARAEPLLDPVALAEAGKIALHSVTATVIDQGGAQALQLEFSAQTDWPNAKFDAPQAYQVTDWSTSGAIAVTLTNPMDRLVDVAFRIDDDATANGAVHCRQGHFELAAGQTETITMALASFPGMRGSPPLTASGASFRSNNTALNLEHMIAFQIFLPKPKSETTLILSKVELLPFTGLTAFVDQYGQYTGAEWPGKVYQEAELTARRAAEQDDLEAHPGPADRDPWGGWTGGPTLEATGRFRTQKVDGKWWLVDPDGRLFWSAGVTGIRPFSDGPIKGRESYFTWLPAEDGPFAKFYNRNNGVLNFYGLNVQRKYGVDSFELWRDVSHRRLRSWGFTTIGNWSDPAVWADHRTAYTVPVHAGVPTFDAGLNKPFPDVFDERWAVAIDAKMAEVTRGDDPWCIGYFIDNELGWGWGPHPLTTGALKLSADKPVKAALVADLKAKYGTVDKLNAAWGVTLADWAAAESPLDLDRESLTKAGPDLEAFELKLARRYFAVCRDAVRKHAPGALYLGCRFSNSSDAALQAAGESCDVVCFNIYNSTPHRRDAQVEKIGDKPVVIGEFHFGALDRGMFHTGLGPTASQEERAAAFTTYLEDALAAPWCVGAHWFQYLDQPLTGRFDGENYNIGWVTITDTPYPEMRSAARELLDRLYPLRAEAPNH